MKRTDYTYHPVQGGWLQINLSSLPYSRCLSGLVFPAQPNFRKTGVKAQPTFPIAQNLSALLATWARRDGRLESGGPLTPGSSKLLQGPRSIRNDRPSSTALSDGQVTQAQSQTVWHIRDSLPKPLSCGFLAASSVSNHPPTVIRRAITDLSAAQKKRYRSSQLRDGEEGGELNLLEQASSFACSMLGTQSLRPTYPWFPISVLSSSETLWVDGIRDQKALLKLAD
ncbi:hypothetical protein CC2G_009386 [Coprinopsis cinerea AmutBmut pab1-1]|nr:hypothetical protein CC2G_009386 [Coprinopsis cinerea AmutBmut pab1-1]